MRRCLPKHMIQASRRVPWVVKEGCVKANCRDSTKGRKDSMLVHMGEPPCPCELQSLQGYEDPPFLSPSCYILWTLVHLNLRKFRYTGVLISDFYGGYDACECRQQKCLVHLIRDLNDDLWKNPFNSELEGFVGTVKDLLV